MWAFCPGPQEVLPPGAQQEFCPTPFNGNGGAKVVFLWLSLRSGGGGVWLGTAPTRAAPAQCGRTSPALQPPGHHHHHPPPPPHLYRRMGHGAVACLKAPGSPSTPFPNRKPGPKCRRSGLARGDPLAHPPNEGGWGTLVRVPLPFERGGGSLALSALEHSLVLPAAITAESVWRSGVRTSSSP